MADSRSRNSKPPNKSSGIQFSCVEGSMTPRTFAIGDIHGELDHLLRLLDRIPCLTSEDTLLFIGDYLDRGPKSAQVLQFLIETLPEKTQATIVTLRGNHEDAWLKVLAGNDSGFVLPAGNGCLATLRSFQDGVVPEQGAFPSSLQEMEALTSGAFFPPSVVDWMRNLPLFHEDEHGIYVHGGLPTIEGGWRHPLLYEDQTQLAWCRDAAFFASYRGKRVVFGHTPTTRLPQHLSVHTPLDLSDIYIAGDVVGIDTGCGSGGFLSAVELPSLTIYESRDI